MLTMLWKLMPIPVAIALASSSDSAVDDNAVATHSRALQGAIGKLVRAQEGLVRPLTDADREAWQILDDAIGYLIGAEYPLRNSF